MKTLSVVRLSLLSILAMFVVSVVPLTTSSVVHAQDPREKALCEGSGGVWSGGKDGKCSTPGSTRTVPNTIRRIITILIFIVGAVAVLMIVIGGMRYVLSGGDDKAITSAKNTILYSIIGVIVAVSAYAIVSFVLDNLGIK